MTVGVISVFHFLSVDSMGKYFTIIPFSPWAHYVDPLFSTKNFCLSLLIRNEWIPGIKKQISAIHLDQGQQIASVKGPMVNILGFTGHAVYVATYLLNSATIAWEQSDNV